MLGLKKKLHPKEHRELRSGAGICQFLVYDRATLRHRLQYEGNHERGSF